MADTRCSPDAQASGKATRDFSQPCTGAVPVKPRLLPDAADTRKQKIETQIQRIFLWNSKHKQGCKTKLQRQLKQLRCIRLPVRLRTHRNRKRRMWVRAAVQMHVQAKVKPHLHASKNALPQKISRNRILGSITPPLSSCGYFCVSNSKRVMTARRSRASAVRRLSSAHTFPISTSCWSQWRCCRIARPSSSASIS